MAPARSTTKATHESVVSGLNRTALALAVYASPGPLLDRTQDALLVAGQALPGRIDYLQGFIERFQMLFIPLSQACPGAGRIPFVFRICGSPGATRPFCSAARIK